MKLIPRISSYNRRAIWISALSALVIGLGAYSLGKMSGYEAKELLRTSLPGVNTLCNTIVLASATILALLLTLLSVSSGTKSKLKEDHYLHVLAIAKLDTIVFVVSMILFQLLNLPITESENVLTEFYTIIYYTALAASALISGALIAVVVMLYNAVASIIKIVGLKVDDHPLIYDEESSEENNSEEVTNSDTSDDSKAGQSGQEKANNTEVNTYEEVKK